MYKEKLLMTPGPTMLPPEVIQTMGRQIIHHRTAEFEQVFKEMLKNLKAVFQTQNHVLTMVSSGTGAMEAAVCNFFSYGEKVLVVSIGNFGERFAQIAAAYGLQVEKMDFPWGEAADISKILSRLNEDKAGEIRGVFITHNETSTGVTNDIRALGLAMQSGDRLLIVDAISSAGGLNIEADAWGLDVVVSGSQKALMAPPGLSYTVVSEKAWQAYEKSKLPKFYFDLKKYKKGILKEISENPPFTPAISLIMGQAEALRLILSEGLENVFKRHQILAVAVQKGVEALGMPLLPDINNSSYIITAVKAIEGMDIEKVRKIMNNRYDIMLTGGQKHLKGKILRIGHCGYVNKFDIIKTFVALEEVLRETGYPVEPGVSIAAVRKVFMG